MSNLIQPITFTVPLTTDAYQWANRFSHRQKNSQKNQNVYLNTLAVYAVNLYCHYMEIETDLYKSFSWNLASQLLMNVADLQIKGVGQLECIPVLPNTKVCHVPPEVWSDRIGYVVVQIDENYHEATLLGFVKKVTNEVLPLSRLDTLEDLIDCLEPLPNNIIEPQEGFVRLSEWFEGLFCGGWQRKELKSADISLFLRSADLPEVNAAKVMRLIVPMCEHTVTLMIRQRKLSEEEINICLRLYPGNNSFNLPDGVKLIVLDEFDEPIPSLEVEAKADSWLQLQFTGSPGDKFSIRIDLAADYITETFII